MQRRTLLTTAGAALASTAAGCMGRDDEPSDDADEADGIPGFDAETVVLGLAERDLAIEVFEYDDDVVTLEYVTDATDGDEALAEVELVAGLVPDAIVDADAFGEAVETVSVTLLADDGDAFAWFDIEAAWAIDVANDDLSEEAYAEKILETLT